MRTISTILAAALLLGQNAFGDELDSGNFSESSQPSATSAGSSSSTNSATSTSGAKSVKLNKSVVTAVSGKEKNIVDAPASVSVVSGEELAKKPFRDVAEAINEVPGVSLDETSTKLGPSSISIRGMPSGYTLFLIDGLRQNPSGDVATTNLGTGVYNSFMPPLAAIERIEVIRGPMSTLYGSDAIGGVVNIVTKPVAPRWSGNFTTQAMIPESKQFGQTYQNSLYLTGPLSKHWGLTLRARQIYKQKGEKPTNNLGQTVNSFLGARYELYTLGGRLTYMPNDAHQVYADIDYTYSKYDNRNENIGTLGVNSQGEGGYAPWVGVNKLLASLAHKMNFDGGSWKSSFQYLNMQNTGRLVAGNTSSPNLGKNRNITSNDFILDTRALFYLGDSNNLNIGAEYRHEAYYDLAATPAGHNRNTFALFAEDEWRIFNPLSLTLGARYNYNDKFGSNLSPRAYLVYEISEGWAIKGGVATGYKAPYANQLIDAVYGYGSQGKQAFLGNPDLKAESSLSYELGTIFEGEHIDFSLMLFRTNFKDKIEGVKVNKTADSVCQAYGGSSSDCTRLINSDSAFSQGVEASFGVKPIYGIGFDTSYTFTESEITSGRNKGRPLSSIAKHNALAKLSFTHGKFNAFLQGQYKAGLTNTTALTTPAVQSYLGGIYYKPYSVINLGLGYKFSEFVRLNGGVYNLLDTNFVDFQSVSGTNVNPYGLIQEGRRYWVSLSIDF